MKTYTYQIELPGNPRAGDYGIIKAETKEEAQHLANEMARAMFSPRDYRKCGVIVWEDNKDYMRPL